MREVGVRTGRQIYVQLLTEWDWNGDGWQSKGVRRPIDLGRWNHRSSSFVAIQESSVVMADFGKVNLPKYGTSGGGLDMFYCLKGSLEFWDGVLKMTHGKVKILNLRSDGLDSKALIDVHHKHLFANGVGIDAEDLFNCSKGVVIMRFESLINRSFHRPDLIESHWGEERRSVTRDERTRIDIVGRHDGGNGIEANCFHCSKWRSLYSRRMSGALTKSDSESHVFSLAG